MSMRVNFLASTFLLSVLSPVFAQSSHTAAERDLITKLESEGYTDIKVNSGAEATTATAVKDGKDVSFIVDSNGKVQAWSKR